MKNILKVTIVLITSKLSLCNIAGISYMDPINFRNIQLNWPTGPVDRAENPCNPLYWYPRQLPDFCYKTAPKPKPVAAPVPVPIPAPLPPPQIPMPSIQIPQVPIPMPQISMPPIPMPVPMPIPMPMPMPLPRFPLPYGVPIHPTNPMLPVAQNPYPSLLPSPFVYSSAYPRKQVGFVPGVPGIVSRDGGINILPFSDIYSDMLEKHKQKMIRKRVQKILSDYDDFPKRVLRKKIRHGIMRLDD